MHAAIQVRACLLLVALALLSRAGLQLGMQPHSRLDLGTEHSLPPALPRNPLTDAQDAYHRYGHHITAAGVRLVGKGPAAAAVDVIGPTNTARAIRQLGSSGNRRAGSNWRGQGVSSQWQSRGRHCSWLALRSRAEPTGQADCRECMLVGKLMRSVL